MPCVIDYSYDHPTVARIYSFGSAMNPVIGVMRYVSPVVGKNLTRPEYASLRAAGLAVGLVWEGGASGALGGQAQGTKDGAAANAQADALGYPKTAAIYFAVDFEATPSQIPTVLNYLRAVDAASPRRVGVYGSYAVVEAAAKAGVGELYWQTSGWSYGQLSPHRSLYQHVYNQDTDVNEVLTGDWGQDTATPPKPKPKPPAPVFPLAAGQVFGRDVTSGHGLDVWQRRMADRGWTIAADGSWGPQTAGVCHDFQAEKHLGVDSLLGPLTWAAAWAVPIS